MLKRVAALMVLAIVVSSCADSKSSGGAHGWKTDYAAALAEAKSARKPLILDFFAEW